MFMLEDDGPFPLEGDCHDVVILHRDGFPQAYLAITNICEIPTPDGYSPLGEIEEAEGAESQLAPVSKIFQISVYGDWCVRCSRTAQINSARRFVGTG